MSAITANGEPILDGTSIVMPSRGRWTATLCLGAESPLIGPVVVRAFDGRLELHGFVVRGTPHADILRAFVVGGAGGLGKDVAARGYQNIPARVIVSEILSEVGERLSTESSPKLDTVQTHWARQRGSAESALDAIVSAVGLTWRVLPDGSVWAGDEGWPEYKDDECTVLDKSDASGSAHVACPTISLRPGVTFDGMQLRSVTHHVASGGIRSTAYYGERDRVRGSLEKLVGKVSRTEHLACYRYTVVSQAGAFLNLKPESDAMPPLTNVPVRFSVPSELGTVAPGAKVLVSFEDGDPSRPCAEGFVSGKLIEWSIAPLKATIDTLSLDVGTGAMPVAHASEVLGMIAAISGALNAFAASLDALGSAPGPVLHPELPPLGAPFKALAGALAALTPTMPTKVLKAA